MEINQASEVAAVVGQSSPLAEYLPFNRKERYYTGTVLPGMVSGDDFEHLAWLLQLAGLDVSISHDPQTRLREIQFLTEYGFAESAWHLTDGKWAVDGKDTPDVVIAGPDWLLAIEAKMYARQGKVAIATQLAAQQALLDQWREVLGLGSDRVRLVALLPSSYANDLGNIGWPVVTWESVADRYRGVGATYWCRVLDEALARYDELKSKFGDASSFGLNADDRLTGLEILTGHDNGTLTFTYVGRAGGPSGKSFNEDVASGAWKTRTYEVRSTPIDAPNWWSITQFIEAVRPADESDGLATGSDAVFVAGEPALLLSRREVEWQAAVRARELVGLTDIVLDFSVATWRREGNVFDLDNLVDPVLAVVGAPASQRRSLWATVRLDAEPGVRISTGSPPTIPDTATQFVLANPPRRSVRTSEPLVELAEVAPLDGDGPLGCVLVLGSDSGNLAFGFEGAIKPTIDALWPVIGRTTSGAADHRIRDLRVWRDEQQVGVRVALWRLSED